MRGERRFILHSRYKLKRTPSPDLSPFCKGERGKGVPTPTRLSPLRSAILLRVALGFPNRPTGPSSPSMILTRNLKPGARKYLYKRY